MIGARKREGGELALAALFVSFGLSSSS